MFLFGKKSPLVCYLTGGTLTIFHTGNDKQSFSFPFSYIQYGEIIDEKKYREELQKFLKESRLKEKKGILVLSHELVFFKEIKAPYQSEKDEIDFFLREVPLAKSNIVAISLHNTRKLQILAANRKLYERIAEVFRNNDIEIFAVVPSAVFNAKNALEFTNEEIKNILKERKTIERYDFLQSKQNSEVNKVIEQSDFQTLEEEKKNAQKQYVFLALSLVLLTGAIGYFLLWSEIIPNPWFKKPAAPKEMPSANVASISAQPAFAEKLLTMDKSSVTIQILNGSGIEGQAEEINLLLQDAGYENIVTGNTASLELTTKIAYKSQVPKEISDNIAEEVKKTFSEIAIDEASQSAEFDVVITTGNR